MNSHDHPTRYETGPLGTQACVALWCYPFPRPLGPSTLLLESWPVSSLQGKTGLPRELQSSHLWLASSKIYFVKFVSLDFFNCIKEITRTLLWLLWRLKEIIYAKAEKIWRFSS